MEATAKRERKHLELKEREMELKEKQFKFEREREKASDQCESAAHVAPSPKALWSTLPIWQTLLLLLAMALQFRCRSRLCHCAVHLCKSRRAYPHCVSLTKHIVSGVYSEPRMQARSGTLIPMRGFTKTLARTNALTRACELITAHEAMHAPRARARARVHVHACVQS
eukprot:4338432-Pleurochrysis_carterae.AAC.2